MNKLLNNISWSVYLETMSLLAVAYYAFIIWKYYRCEITALYHRLSGQQAGQGQLPAALQYQPEEPAEPAAAPTITGPEEAVWKQDTFSDESRELSQRLLACIAAATGKPYAPAILIPQLKHILNDFPDIAATTRREDINALIVRECENTGTALLSESEVDMWWSA